MPTLLDDNADYTLQAKTKAVVFTHIGLWPEHIVQQGQNACIAEYVPLFERYLKCRNVGLVYMYLSLGAEEIVRAIVAGHPLVIPPDVIRAENECGTVLTLAEYSARRMYPNSTLKFIHVTTHQLMALFDNLHHIDPSLFNFLYSGGVFSYDSPRFVEAVIRIARGQDPRSAHYPVVRFDEDIHVSEKALDKLLVAYEDFLSSSDNLYFFFSGCYGDPDDPDELDPINDRAVRTHWFSQGIGDTFSPSESNVKQIKLFWRDLGEVGATQLGVNDSPSLRGQSLIAERGFTANRRTPQVISGAGQIVSLRCAQDLPPFLNMRQLTVWIDDHLTRQLYEGIGHVFQDDLESVTEARFWQNRHPAGIAHGDMKWARSDGGYFERLLAGCMMDSLISQPVGERNRVIHKPTEFARAIKAIIANPAAQLDFNEMIPRLKEYAERRHDQVLGLWQTPEFEGTVLYQWACEKAMDAEYKNRLVTDIVGDAGDYLKLVQRWRGSFAAAIGRLTPIGNLWLFERVQ